MGAHRTGSEDSVAVLAMIMLNLLVIGCNGEVDCVIHRLRIYGRPDSPPLDRFRLRHSRCLFCHRVARVATFGRVSAS
jgi:hypothetical protein